MSSLGIPQITAIMGMCVAGGCVSASDDGYSADDRGVGVVSGWAVAWCKRRSDRRQDPEELGGAAMHAAISGTVDFKEPNDHLVPSAAAVVGGEDGRTQGSRSRHRGLPAPCSSMQCGMLRSLLLEDVYGLLNPEPGSSNVYDMREVIARIVDRSEFDEYKAEFGRTVLCGYAWIGGRAVGIVANQKINQNQTVAMGPAAGLTHMEVGGVIYTESAQKAARFIMDCNQNLVPLVFLHDVNGFMVGKEAEWSGIIRAGAKMVSAVSTSVVPKITVIVGGSFGAGHYAMCCKAYDPRFLFAWPTARYAVMSGASAAATLAEVRARQMERGGKALSEAEKTALYDEIRATYDTQADPRYGAARLWIDAIIDPARTRDVLIQALEACALNPDLPRFNPGVLQT
jgi:3-methylcrotonyl-CoA carboxylase beta subunit